MFNIIHQFITVCIYLRLGTSFLEAIYSTQDKRRYDLKFSREERDNPRQSKYWDNYAEKVQIEIYNT